MLPDRAVAVMRLFGLTLLILALQPGSALADAAATAQFVFGAVHRIDATGASTPLQRGDHLLSGDSVATGEDGRAHLRFTDGGFVSLNPNSEFRIDAYRYSGQPDPADHVRMSLLKGALRTVTGEISRLSRDAYEMATRVATIGIRGTEYTLQYVGASVTGSVAHGRIEVCNAAGCLELGAGQSFFVKDANTRPALTEQTADLAPPQPSTANHIDDTHRTLQSFMRPREPGGAPVDNTPPSGNGGGPPKNNGGIGFDIIGVTAPNVDAPVRGGVSDFVHEGSHPGRGWGAGGSPPRGPNR